MKNMSYKDRSCHHTALAVYDAKLRVQKRRYPAHPKQTKSLHVAQIAAETKIPAWHLRSGPVAEQLARLSRGRIADPCAERRTVAAERIRARYEGRPLPRRGKGYHKSAVALEADVQVRDLDSAECKTVLDQVMRDNGLADVILDRSADRAALDAYIATLQARGEKMPANAATGRVDVSRVAKATGIVANRLYQEPVKSELAKLSRIFGVEPVEPLAMQARRVVDFVDRAIETLVPPPEEGGKVSYTGIATQLEIPVHRLRSNQGMRAQIDRWVNSCSHAKIRMVMEVRP